MIAVCVRLKCVRLAQRREVSMSICEQELFQRLRYGTKLSSDQSALFARTKLRTSRRIQDKAAASRRLLHCRATFISSPAASINWSFLHIVYFTRFDNLLSILSTKVKFWLFIQWLSKNPLVVVVLVKKSPSRSFSPHLGVCKNHCLEPFSAVSLQR